MGEIEDTTARGLQDCQTPSQSLRWRVEGGVVDGELKKTKLGWSRERIIELTNKWCKML